ncbi:VRR-NUC domain protein [compost metagenome]
MATTDEGRVKLAATKLYKQHHAVYDRAATTGMGRNGRPDDLVCRAGDGHFLAVEFKKLNVCKVTKLQQIWLDNAAKAGGSALVINAENLWLLEYAASHPGVRVTPTFAPAKEGATCVGHYVHLSNDGAIVVRMNTPKPENLS